VLRIHLILIRILYPHWKKMDPDPGHFFKIWWIFITKNNFQMFCFIFFACFYPKTWWTIQKWGNFYNFSFLKIQIWGLGVKKFFFAVFGWYFTPWIRIRGSAYYCGSRSGSKTPKSCVSNGSGSGSDPDPDQDPD